MRRLSGYKENKKTGPSKDVVVAPGADAPAPPALTDEFIVKYLPFENVAAFRAETEKSGSPKKSA